MLSIAYGKDQSDGHDVHKPDLCYPAQGFTVIEQRELPIVLDAHRKIIVKYMKTQKGQRVEPLVYWTTAGNFVYRTKLQKKIIGFRYSRKNLIPDGMVIRISTLEDDSAVALELISNFIQDFYNSMPEEQRSRYFGERNL
jgi:EpsI family protein